ncbi:MAG: aminotransferase class V-fold PLP-dependent enzyme [Caldilineales bacterium]
MTTPDHAPYNLRSRIVGIDERVPLLDGSLATYVNLDNAASTPALTDVLDAVDRFMPYYSSVHRGTGFKSRLSTLAYDQAHEIIAAFVGANPETNAVIFGKNTTEAINKLSFRLPARPGAVVITTQLEHHSNDLPWRARFPVEHVRALPDGRLDEAHFDELLAQHAGNIALVTVTGASNVSGFLQPIHRLARKAHAAGALILVDAAQLAPHRRVDMKADDDPEHLDFVTLSAHKMYAPFGTGALIGPKSVFMQGAPEYPGGGTVDVVTLDEVHWAGMPDRDEAGSPNVVGAVAMAAAARALMDVGMDRIAAHEQDLLAYATERLLAVPGVTIYGERDFAPGRKSRRDPVQPCRSLALPAGRDSGLRGRHRRAQRLLLCSSLCGASAEPGRGDRVNMARATSGRRQIQHAGDGAHELRLLQQPRGRGPPGGHAGARRPRRLHRQLPARPPDRRVPAGRLRGTGRQLFRTVGS